MDARRACTRAARSAPAALAAVAAVAAVALATVGLGACGDAHSAPGPHATAPLVALADVVAVQVLPSAGGQTATGVRVGGGRVLTVAHALPTRAHPGRATVAHVGPTGRPARLVARDDAADLAVLATPVGAPAARPRDAPRPRDRRDPGPASGSATTPGAPDPADTSASGWRVLLRRDGRVVRRPVALRRRITARVDAPGSGTDGRRPALELAVRAAPGDSGAPVVDAAGRLIGVVFAISNGQTTTAYAVTARPAVALLRAAGRR
jgi:S1-C subfamily serine protease